MRCGDGIDTDPDVIRHACGMWYYPNDTGSGKPCKFYKKCQNSMKWAIENVEWAKSLHESYLVEKAMKKKIKEKC